MTARALAALAGVLKCEPALAAQLRAPALGAADKTTLVGRLQKQAGADRDGVLRNFLATLADNNRLGVLEGVCDKFEVLMSAFRGEVELVVTSAAVRCPLPSSPASIIGFAVTRRADQTRSSPLRRARCHASNPPCPSRSTWVRVSG